MPADAEGPYWTHYACGDDEHMYYNTISLALKLKVIGHFCRLWASVAASMVATVITIG